MIQKIKTSYNSQNIFIYDTIQTYNINVQKIKPHFKSPKNISAVNLLHKPRFAGLSVHLFKIHYRRWTKKGTDKNLSAPI